MKLRHLLLAMIAATFLSTDAQDAELHKEIKASEQRYAGVFPPEVKTIALISPASYPGSPSHKRGIELLRAAGYKIKLGAHAFDKPPKGKSSAPLEARLEDFYNAWNDDEVDMILCVRGGSGSQELLNNLDFSKLKRRDNLRFQGYSDITILLCAFQGKNIGQPIAGPMSGSIVGLKLDCIEEMKQMHHGLAIGPVPVTPIIPGDCSGLPLAGHLERYTRVWKSSFKPDTKGRIIIVECVHRTVEQIKQCFDELIDGGFFQECAAVVFADFTRCGTPQEIDPILEDVAKRVNKPTYKGFPFGHTSQCYTIDFRRQFVIKDNQIFVPAN
ncbi:MAG: LD-carboxypeptidase [Victivallales bacterium]|nr:LD-carboxypeptidase [Victivallales bacterium]